MDKSIAKFAPLSDLGLLRISGSQARAFLQGQVTCDMLALDAANALWGACCNNKGRVLATFIVCIYQDDMLLIMPQATMTPLSAHLNRYAPFHQVTLSDVTASFTAIATWENTSTLPPGFAQLTPSTQINISTHDGLNQTCEQLQQKAEICSASDWHQQRIQQGIALIYPETHGLYTAHQLNLASLGFISFQKGCYTGQEIIARTEYRGQVKQCVHWHRLTGKENGLARGASITVGDKVGTLIDFVENDGAFDGLILY